MGREGARAAMIGEKSWMMASDRAFPSGLGVMICVLLSTIST